MVEVLGRRVDIQLHPVDPAVEAAVAWRLVISPDIDLDIVAERDREPDSDGTVGSGSNRPCRMKASSRP
jgi:hypothetical protein